MIKIWTENEYKKSKTETLKIYCLKTLKILHDRLFAINNFAILHFTVLMLAT